MNKTDDTAQHDTRTSAAVEQPPVGVWAVLRRLGPGLIIAGSIVGSGELIATTVTGAQAGFWLLWLILIGCVIKVFVQVELGRYAVVHGRTTMDGLDEVPGPRLQRGGNWLVWYWAVMFVVALAQLGGIVGGVGQALAISAPLTENGRRYNEVVQQRIALQIQRQEIATGAVAADDIDPDALDEKIERLQAECGELEAAAHDAKYWAAIVTAITAATLVVGRYGLIQSVATALVALFTLVTVVNLLAMQTHSTWAVSGGDLLRGLSFRLPPTDDTDRWVPLATALATFGIIGVGAHELIAYPYWCIEKGYARFTGPRDESPEWAARARGWLRVMRIDALCSMVVYTFATIAFYLLGAAVLSRIDLVPAGNELISTLSAMYEPVFDHWFEIVFLFGSIAVLYSTFFVANAGHARVCADALRVMGLAAPSEAARRRRVRIFSGLFPVWCLVLYLVFPEPVKLVLASGVMQAIMLPMLAAAALYFRYYRCDRRVAPTRHWDAWLWLSGVAMLLTALCVIITQVLKYVGSSS